MKKILSVTDVITNSSTEVFAYKKDSEEFRKLTEFLGPELTSQFETYDTLEDIWNSVTKEDYYRIMDSEWEQCRHGNSEWTGPKIDIFYPGEWELRKKLLDSGKTKREVFDFFSSQYEPALNIAFHSVSEGEDRDELAERICEYEDLQYEREKEEDRKKLELEMSGVKPGDYLAVSPKSNNFLGWTKSIIIESAGGTGIRGIYMPEADGVCFCSESTEIEGLFECATTFADLRTYRVATDEEIMNYRRARDGKDT